MGTTKKSGSVFWVGMFGLLLSIGFVFIGCASVLGILKGPAGPAGPSGPREDFRVAVQYQITPEIGVESEASIGSPIIQKEWRTASVDYINLTKTLGSDDAYFKVEGICEPIFKQGNSIIYRPGNIIPKNSSDKIDIEIAIQQAGEGSYVAKRNGSQEVGNGVLRTISFFIKKLLFNSPWTFSLSSGSSLPSLSRQRTA
ncbi:hypothetical protein AGMMS4952_18440 [Spirochaetia bacterium]|nr:hypothetical protein AGMMS4952_18440 [Spirochaetia bacterium]